MKISKSMHVCESRSISQPLQMVFAATDLPRLIHYFAKNQTSAEVILSNTNTRIQLKHSTGDKLCQAAQ